ncbi:MAG TPA: hypothetical protein VFB13_05350 [Reyranella sp.]|nr:hypothetical protein [Reyranella sp.]
MTTRSGHAAQVEELRDLARRARRLAASLHQETERLRLERHAEELDQQADQLEAKAKEGDC